MLYNLECVSVVVLGTDLAWVWNFSFKKIITWSVWPDLAIFWTLGNFLKRLATINLLKSPTFLGNFCKGIKIYLLLVKSFFGNFYRHLAIFSGHTAHNRRPDLVRLSLIKMLYTHDELFRRPHLNFIHARMSSAHINRQAYLSTVLWLVQTYSIREFELHPWKLVKCFDEK